MDVLKKRDKKAHQKTNFQKTTKNEGVIDFTAEPTKKGRKGKKPVNTLFKKKEEKSGDSGNKDFKSKGGKRTAPWSGLDKKIIKPKTGDGAE
jgi:hypothetical protein